MGWINQDIKTIKTNTWTIFKKKKKNRFLRVKNSCLNIGKDLKAINVSINDMKKFEEKEISKRRAIGKKYLKQLAGLIN